MLRWVRRFLHKHPRRIPTDIWTAARDFSQRRVSYYEGYKWLTLRK